MVSFPSFAPASKDPRDVHLVIREVVPGIVTFSQPFARFGAFPIGGRTTAIRLQDDKGIFVYVSHPLTDATKEALQALGGEVKWLVTPDGEHGMNISAWSEKFPNAQTIGVRRFGKLKPEVKWAGLFGAGGEEKTYGFEPEVSLHQVSAHVNHELAAIHHPSGTLLEADLLFNLPPKEQYSRTGGVPMLVGWLGGSLSPGGILHNRMANSIFGKKQELAKTELATITAAKWDRIIPCHGDVIETGGKAAWQELFAKYLPPVDSSARS